WNGVAPPAHADAAVALTGGAGRIAAAMDLLADGRVGRLLVSGVNKSVTKASFAKARPGETALVECCVDLGYGARNTRGNAAEAAAWAVGRGVKSVVVVTSAWHMPRTMMEFSRAMPGVALVADPVPPPDGVGPWWRDPRLARIVASEYLKYLASFAHVPYDPGDFTEPAPIGVRGGS
ncbi:MAG: YdcF family protein, partial [Hyphomicrobiales bacterium]|nr:YdcF family protein [Hyphomicrobiales bacterium]